MIHWRKLAKNVLSALLWVMGVFFIIGVTAWACTGFGLIFVIAWMIEDYGLAGDILAWFIVIVDVVLFGSIFLSEYTSFSPIQYLTRFILKNWR